MPLRVVDGGRGGFFVKIFNLYFFSCFKKFECLSGKNLASKAHGIWFSLFVEVLFLLLSKVEQLLFAFEDKSTEGSYLFTVFTLLMY